MMIIIISMINMIMIIIFSIIMIILNPGGGWNLLSEAQPGAGCNGSEFLFPNHQIYCHHILLYHNQDLFIIMIMIMKNGSEKSLHRPYHIIVIIIITLSSSFQIIIITSAPHHHFCHHQFDCDQARKYEGGRIWINPINAKVSKIILMMMATLDNWFHDYHNGEYIH